MPKGFATSTSPRDRLLAAADELFYREGIESVGIDRVIARASVAKASLYKNFGSKEGLVRAYLSGRHESRQRRIARRLALYEEPRDRILAVFETLEEIFNEPGYRGCPFLNASGEARPGSAADDVICETRAWVFALFVDLCRAANATEPELLARRLVLVYDGASVTARLDRMAAAAEWARTLAAELVDGACPP